MNKNLNEDSPLFSSEKCDDTTFSDKLELERVTQNNRRFNKLIDIGTKSVKWIVILALGLIVLDMSYQYFGLDNSLIKEAFSVVKYAITTILGFIFASNCNKSS